MVVAFVALCVALAGTATALPGRARVKKDDIARAAVRSVHIKSRAIQSKHIKSRAVTRSKIAKRAVSSERGRPGRPHRDQHRRVLAGTVADRLERDNAGKVNGRSVEKIAFVAGAGTAADDGAVPQRAHPDRGLQRGTGSERQREHRGQRRVRSTPAERTAGGGSFYIADDSFNVGDSFDVLDSRDTQHRRNCEGTLTYARPDGEVVTATFLAEETGDRLRLRRHRHRLGRARRGAAHAVALQRRQSFRASGADDSSTFTLGPRAGVLPQDTPHLLPRLCLPAWQGNACGCLEGAECPVCGSTAPRPR